MHIVTAFLAVQLCGLPSEDPFPMPLAFLAMQISALPKEHPFPVLLLDALGTRQSNFKQIITGRILAHDNRKRILTCPGLSCRGDGQGLHWRD